MPHRSACYRVDRSPFGGPAKAKSPSEDPSEEAARRLCQLALQVQEQELDEHARSAEHKRDGAQEP